MEMVWVVGATHTQQPHMSGISSEWMGGGVGIVGDDWYRWFVHVDWIGYCWQLRVCFCFFLINWLIDWWVGRCGGWGGNLWWGKMVDTVGLVDLIGFDVVDGWCVLIFFYFFFDLIRSWVWLVCAWCTGRTLILLVWWTVLDLILLTVGLGFFWFFFHWLIDWLSWTLWWVGR